jgi:DNA-binding NtrC family response regulator
VGGARVHEAQARLIVIDQPPAAGGDGAGLRPELLLRLKAGQIVVPALRDRLEDIPACTRMYLAAVGASKQLGQLEVSPDGYRTLFAHTWPGNTRELRRVLEQAAVAAQGPLIGSAELAAAIGARSAAAADRPMAEKEWILDGLRRNRFRRGATAAFLGLSRKTLLQQDASTRPAGLAAPATRRAQPAPSRSGPRRPRPRPRARRRWRPRRPTP